MAKDVPTGPTLNLQRILVFAVLIVFVFLAATVNFMAFFLNWEDTILHGVRLTSDFQDLLEPDCEDHPWSRNVYQECERASGVGAVGSTVRPEDCVRVCVDDGCAASRRIAAKIVVAFTIISIVLIGLFFFLLIAGVLLRSIQLPWVIVCFIVTILSSFGAWFPFWLSRHGYVTSCPGTDFCPHGAARCDVHGFAFMFICTILLCVGGTLSLFFEFIYLRFFASKPVEGVQQLMLLDYIYARVRPGHVVNTNSSANDKLRRNSEEEEPA